MTACPGYQHDFDALRAAPARIVLGIGIGTQSSQMMPGRAAAAVAARLGTTPVTFPGGHNGFQSDPGTFAAVLRTILDN